MTGIRLETFVDAKGEVLEAPPGRVPPGSIGGVVKTPNGMLVAVPVTEQAKVIDGNLGAYETF